MIFSIVIFLMVGVVAFFHYVQGFFSATISAMIAVLAAVLAVSYHETIVELLLKGRLPDYAHPMVLCMIFVVVYIVLRVIFDAAIPGNVRTPAIVDKLGAGLMGLVAGVFCAGIFAIAAQMLPFDPGISFMGYSRYPLTATRKLIIPQGGTRQSLDTHVDNELVDSSLDPDKEKGLLLPVDDWVLDTVYHLSEGGSLAGDRTLASMHPDYLQELFGQRLGIQVSARRSALEINGNNPIEVAGVYTAATLAARDGTIKDVRPAGYTPSYKNEVKPGPGQAILVVRVKVTSNATDDEDTFFRFSTGSVRVVGPGRDGGFKNFYPIGTMERANLVLLNKPDDFLFVKEGDSFDAVFVVDQSLVTGGKCASGVFINVKRFGLEDLSGHAIKTSIPVDPAVKVLRSPFLLESLNLPAAPAASAAPQQQQQAPAPTPSAAAAVTPADNTPAAAPQPSPGKEISDDISAAINAGFMAPGSISLGTNVADQEAKDAPVAGGKISLQGGQIASATVDPTSSLSQLGQGASAYNQFFTPPQRTMVQVQIHPYTNTWEWMSQYGSTNIIDSNGNKYPPSGAYALVKGTDSRALMLRYDASHAVSVSSPSGDPDGAVYFIFLIPSSTELKSFTMGGKTQDLSSILKVP